MKRIIDYITSSLTGVYTASEARELAYWIVEETTGLTRTDILCCKDTQNISNIEIILQRLLKKEPIEYIFGHKLWNGLDLKLNSATLIPRPETAELIPLIGRVVPLTRARVLDIGCGSGCIAIALKQAHPSWEVTGVDISKEAVAVAQENAARNGVKVVFERVDILSDEIGENDIIVSNPPYITTSEQTTMATNVLDYEPAAALFVPDDDPLRFYRRIAAMKKGRHLFFEINERYGAQVLSLMEQLGYVNNHLIKDQYGKDRFVYGSLEA